jgi:hypothetical protein
MESGDVGAAMIERHRMESQNINPIEYTNSPHWRGCGEHGKVRRFKKVQEL